MVVKNRKELVYQRVQREFEALEPNYVLLSKEWVSRKTKLKVQCDNAHPPYEVTWALFKRGCRCPFCYNEQRGNACRLSYEYVKEQIENAGCEMLSTKYKNNYTKLLIQCPNKRHEPFRITWAKFREGHRCPCCASEKAAEAFRLSYDYIKEQIEGVSGYKLLSAKYENAHTKLKIQCNNKKHKPYRVSWANFKQGNRCPKCKYNESRGEREIVRILTGLDIPFVRQHRLQNCRYSPILDFYLPSFNLGIEYDGEQHFKPARFGGISKEKAKENLCKIQQRDRRKDRLCERLGIDLLRIKYTDDVEQVVEECLEQYLTMVKR